MELEWSMRDRIVDVVAKSVGGDDMVDLVVRHRARAQVIEAGKDRQSEDQDDDQDFDGESWPPGENRFVQPAVPASAIFCGGRSKIHQWLQYFF